MEHLSSEELMLQCKRGNYQAFDVLMKRHEGGLIHYFGDRLSYRATDGERPQTDWAKAKDLTQETFFRAFNARERYVPKAKFTTWLYRIALNLYRDEIRRRMQRPTVSISTEFSYEDSEGNVDTYELHETIPDDTLPSALEVVEREEQIRLLESAIHDLKPKHRRVLTLRYFEEMEYAEIAQKLGCSIGTVKSRLHYAAQALRGKVRLLI